MKDYYSILGVTPSASKSEIQRAFRRLALEHHPDVNKKPGAESRFQEINSAYQVLKDPTRRAEYDASRETRPVPTRKSASGGQSDVWRYYFQRRVRAATDPGSTWNYYDVLGVPRNATEETIARAFQRLYGEFYAGRSVDPAAEAILREILEASDVLTDPERRVAYDRLPPDRQPPGSPRQQRSGDGRRQSPGRRQTGTGRRSTARFTVAVGVSILALALGALIVLAL